MSVIHETAVHQPDCPAPLHLFCPFLSPASHVMDKQKWALQSAIDTLLTRVEYTLKKQFPEREPDTTWLQPLRDWKQRLCSDTAGHATSSGAELVGEYKKELADLIERLDALPLPPDAEARAAAPQCQLTNRRRAQILRRCIKHCEWELEVVETCPDCVLNYYLTEDEDLFFSKPCPTPHVAVWAIVKGHPYWPAKLLAIDSGLENHAFVWFFGPKTSTAVVPFHDIHFMTEQLLTDKKDFGNPAADKKKLRPLRKKKDYQTAISSVKSYIEQVQLTPTGHRLKIFWPPSQREYDRSTVTFPMMTSLEDDNEATDSDGTDVSLEPDSFDPEEIFLTKSVMNVPQKHLKSLLRDSRWIREVLIEPTDAVATSVSERSCASLTAPSGPSACASGTAPNGDEAANTDNDATDIDDTYTDADSESDYTEIEDEGAEDESATQFQQPDYSELVRLTKEWTTDQRKILADHYKNKIAQLKIEQANEIADLKKKMAEKNRPLLIAAGRMH